MADATGYALTRAASDFSDNTLTIAAAVQPVVVALDTALRVRDASLRVSLTEPSGVLTEREVDILQLVAAGMTATAIGHARRISSRTVRKHLENAYAKLGVHDRLMAVAQARRLGLIA
jgi:DNA-binding NarL/FixJ family response regulator